MPDDKVNAQSAAVAAGVAQNIEVTLTPIIDNQNHNGATTTPPAAAQSAPELKTISGGPNYQQLAADYIKKKLQSAGATGTQAYGGYFAEEYLPEFKGRNGVLMGDQMRRGDYQVQAVLAHIRNKLLAVNFDWTPANGRDPKAVKHAEFLRHAFFKAPEKPWVYNLKDMLSCLWAGFALFEPTFKICEDQLYKGKWVIKSYGWRNPKTIWQWFVIDDKIWAVRQISYGDDPRYIDIPGNELVCISVGREGNNFEGISLLRGAWGPYCRKQVSQVVNMIGIERSLGVVVVDRPNEKVGSLAETNLKQSLNDFVSGNAPWIIKPVGWPMKIEQITYDVNAVSQSIRMEDANIAKSVQAEFIEVGMTSEGARAAIEPKMEHFDISLKYFVRLIQEAWQKLGEKLIVLNFGEQDVYPQFQGTGLDVSMSEDLANSLKTLTDAGGWTWDYTTRTWIRKIWGAPAMSEEDDQAAQDEKKAAAQQGGNEAGKEAAEHPGTLDMVNKAIAAGKKISSEDLGRAIAADHSKKQAAAGPVNGKEKPAVSVDNKKEKEMHECGCGKGHVLGEKRTVLTEYEKKVNFAELKKRFDTYSDEFNAVVKGNLTKSLAKYKVDLKNALQHAGTDLQARYAAVNNVGLTEGSGRAEDDIYKFMMQAAEWGRLTAYDEVKMGKKEFAMMTPTTAGLIGWVKATAQTISKIQRMDVEKKAKFAALQRLQSDAGDDAVVFGAGEAANDWLEDARNLGGAAVAQNAINEGRFDMFQELGDELQGFQFSALLEGSCALCESLDGNTFKIDDPDNIDMDPPLHPQCQCILVPILKEEEAPEEWTGRADGVDPEDIKKYKSLVEVALR